MKAIILIIVITTLTFFFSCEDDSSTNSSMTTYKYISYSSDARIIISGYFWIDSVDSTTVKGRWNFMRIGNEENLGPQIGKGNFEGITRLGGMSFNLNPEMIDNNVILDGSTLRPRRFEGTWSYIGFPRIINRGTFKAEQIR
jgi:hypothetical protein